MASEELLYEEIYQDGLLLMFRGDLLSGEMPGLGIFELHLNVRYRLDDGPEDAFRVEFHGRMENPLTLSIILAKVVLPYSVCLGLGIAGSVGTILYTTYEDCGIQKGDSIRDRLTCLELNLRANKKAITGAVIGSAITCLGSIG